MVFHRGCGKVCLNVENPVEKSFFVKKFSTGFFLAGGSFCFMEVLFVLFCF